MPKYFELYFPPFHIDRHRKFTNSLNEHQQFSQQQNRSHHTAVKICFIWQNHNSNKKMEPIRLYYFILIIIHIGTWKRCWISKLITFLTDLTHHVWNLMPDMWPLPTAYCILLVKFHHITLEPVEISIKTETPVSQIHLWTHSQWPPVGHSMIKGSLALSYLTSAELSINRIPLIDTEMCL